MPKKEEEEKVTDNRQPTTDNLPPIPDFIRILNQLRDFDTALLANTIGYIDPTPPHEFYMSREIQSVTPALGPTVGVAVTCELDSSTPGNEMNMDLYWQQLEQIKAMELPAVWVVKTIGTRPDHECVLGDGMAKMLLAAGCVGAVTDGSARDIEGLESANFPTYCRGCCIHHTALRVTRFNEPIEVGGITVSPGDVIHANQEGVITVPRACLEILPDALASMRAFEHDVHICWRRSDVSAAEKRDYAVEMFNKHGFDKFASIKL